MITRAKISAVRALGVQRLIEGGAYSRAALIRVNTVIQIYNLTSYYSTLHKTQYCSRRKGFDIYVVPTASFLFLEQFWKTFLLGPLSSVSLKYLSFEKVSWSFLYIESKTTVCYV